MEKYYLRANQVECYSICQYLLKAPIFIVRQSKHQLLSYQKHNFFSEYSTHKVEFELGKSFQQRLGGPNRSLIEHICVRDDIHKTLPFVFLAF